MPYADKGVSIIPDSVTDEQALFAGDVLATGFWAACLSDIKPKDIVLINRGRADGDMHIAVRDAEEACSDSSFSRGTARISLSRQEVWMGAMVTKYWLS